MKSTNTHKFSQVPKAEIPRSSFNRTHGYKTTFDAGMLVPFLADETLPGDTFNVNTTIFARLNTPIVPFMDNLFLDTFYFAVPLRLLWDNFPRMMGEEPNPGDSTDFLVPQLSLDGTEPAHSLGDYLGLPIGTACTVSSLWHRAYNTIYNEWFRDENLQDRAVQLTDDVTQTNADFLLRRRGKRHDYFTSALPWPQKGPGVELPIGETAPIISNYTVPTFQDTTEQLDHSLNMAGGGNLETNNGASSTNPATFGTNTGLEADLSAASAVSINSMRQAFQMQRLMERDARGGTRYTEIIRAHFGTVSPDYRLQRPEYLGGNSTPIMVHQVAQTSTAFSDQTPLGTLAAYGTVQARDGFTKSFTEHCVVLGLCFVRADLTYQRGIPRMFSRKSRFDFYWPALSHLGEQAILNKEIYAQNSSADDDVFGYQERWAEYRYYPSQITGKLRSTDAESLDYWHLAQDFITLPTLSPNFIVDNPPIDRVVAIPSEPDFLLDSYIEMKCARPMPTYSVPGMIDHF